MMKRKSGETQLVNRGFLSDTQYQALLQEAPHHLEDDIQSRSAMLRTFAVRKIRMDRSDNHLPLLIEQLKKEKALYTKLEISLCLSERGEQSIRLLIPLLGKIGKNQHQTPKNIDLQKKSYPLPRDIVARIIGKMGTIALPHLKDVLESDDTLAIYEAIDAIGYISFYAKDNSLGKDIIRLYDEKKHDSLMVWKCIRCLQAFSIQESQDILINAIEDSRNTEVIRNEAKRSLERIRAREHA